MPDERDAIAVLNAGSSSLKFSFFDGSTAVCKGVIDRLGDSQPENPRAVVRNSDGTNLFAGEIPARNHEEALDWLFDWKREHLPAFRPAAIGHRVVHGGDAFTAPTRVTSEVLDGLEALIPLAPLHQPHNLAPIRSLAQKFPQLPQVACFDTAFHANQPRIERMYALPRAHFDRGIKRYGFHGLSYEYIATQLPAIDARAASGRTIVCHLGNGASLCAMRTGKSVATTMGFTALDGLPMGTRCGSIDPGVVLHLVDHEKMTTTDLADLLYHQSGLLGVSGISADMRDLLDSADPRAAQAIEYFCYRAARELGSLTVALGGLDAVVFTGGIGEHAARVRSRIAELAACIGLNVDADANASQKTHLHRAGSSVQVLKIPTNEELMIASHTRRVLAEE